MAHGVILSSRVSAIYLKKIRAEMKLDTLISSRISSQTLRLFETFFPHKENKISFSELVTLNFSKKKVSYLFPLQASEILPQADFPEFYVITISLIKSNEITNFISI